MKIARGTEGGDALEGYAFVDGGYLFASLQKLSGDLGWDHPPGLDVDILMNSTGCRKLFYYDALPSDGDGTNPEHEARLAWNEAVTAIRGGHAFHGKLKRHRRRGNSQKAVDVQLAVDALIHVSRGNCRRVLLIAGDADFIPLIEALVDAGAFVEVWAFDTSCAPELKVLSDYYQVIDLAFATSLLVGPGPRSESGRGISAERTVVGQGEQWELLAGDSCLLLNLKDRGWHVRAETHKAVEAALRFEFGQELEDLIGPENLKRAIARESVWLRK